MNAKKVRLNLLVSKRVRRRLETLKQRTQAESLTEVVRNALSTYDVLTRHQQDGGDIVLRDADGTLTRLRLLS